MYILEASILGGVFTSPSDFFKGPIEKNEINPKKFHAFKYFFSFFHHNIYKLVKGFFFWKTAEKSSQRFGSGSTDCCGPTKLINSFPFGNDYGVRESSGFAVKTLHGCHLFHLGALPDFHASPLTIYFYRTCKIQKQLFKTSKMAVQNPWWQFARS